MKNKFENIVSLPIKPKLSETDIDSLFGGLCKLVKRIAREEAEIEFAKRLNIIENSYKRQIKNLQFINSGLLEKINKKTEASTSAI